MNGGEVHNKTFDNLLESSGWVLLTVLWVATFVTYREVPDLIPIQYNFHGIITKYGDKVTLLFFPLTASIMLTGLSLLIRNPRLFTEKASPFYSIRLIRWLKISLALVFSILILFIHVSTLDHENSLQPFVFPVMIAIVVIPVSYYIYKILGSQ